MRRFNICCRTTLKPSGSGMNLSAFFADTTVQDSDSNSDSDSDSSPPAVAAPAANRSESLTTPVVTICITKQGSNTDGTRLMLKICWHPSMWWRNSRMKRKTTSWACLNRVSYIWNNQFNTVLATSVFVVALCNERLMCLVSRYYGEKHGRHELQSFIQVKSCVIYYSKLIIIGTFNQP